MANHLHLHDLKEDPRFKLRDDRKKNRFELSPYINEKLKGNTTKHWVELLNKRGIPSGEILKLENALNAEQVRHRQTFGDVEIDEIGDVKLFNLTAKFSKTPGVVEKRPPYLSEDTTEILESIGYNSEEIKSFKEQKII